MVIHMIVYYLPTRDRTDYDDSEAILSWVPEQQKVIVASMKSAARRWEHLSAYAMLVYAVQNDKAKIADAECCIEEFRADMNGIDKHTPLPLWSFGEHGKPYITNFDGIEFNISHCRQAVVVAVSNRVVGVDAEGSRRFSETTLGKACSNEERDAIVNADNPSVEFSRIWTHKEAFFKWTGTGILLSQLKDVERLAKEANCTLTTYWIDCLGFFITVAQKA